MVATLPLTLNRNEVMILADRTMNSDAGTPDMPLVAPRLLIKLGILYLDLVNPDSQESREGTIAVTEAEAWHLRGKVQSGDKMAGDNYFGIRLLRKLYTILIEFDADIDGLPSAEGDGETMDQWHKDALSLFHSRKENPDDDSLQTA